MTERGLRERKKADTRAALATATLRLAVEQGWEHVTVEAIAGAASVSYRTFFNHFSSKEEALLQPWTADRPGLADRLRAQPADLTVLDAVRAALRSDVTELEQRPAELHQRMTVVMGNPSLLPRLIEMGAADEREIATAVAERAGLDADADLLPGLVAAVVSSVVRVCCWRWHAQDGATPLSTLVDEALDAVQAGLPTR
ncbi:TetR family transcriptional regulator [Modestobacter sp. NPDC049651]|uniref:TetR/AcrR family transcriptional regulator n=1 Tax=unclassified Modestobacter TaxID=2643866 RepID=UPI0033E281AB